MKKRIIVLCGLLATFSLLSCGNDTTDDYVLSTATPVGAPALAQFELAYNYTEDSNYSVTTLSGASYIKAALISGSYDLIYAPINLGAQVYNSNQSYTLLCGITFGNLYLGSKGEINSLSDLNGKDLVLFGKGTINDLITNYILDSNNIETNSITYVADAATAKTSFVSDSDNKVYLLADPTKSASQIALKGNNISTYFIDIEEEYKNLTTYDGFAQAGLFVKKTTYQNHQDLVLDYLDKLEGSIESLNNLDNVSENNEKITELGYFSLPDAVLKSAIPGCNIRYETASSIKDMVEATYSLNLSLMGGSLPDEGFYQI